MFCRVCTVEILKYVGRRRHFGRRLRWLRDKGRHSKPEGRAVMPRAEADRWRVDLRTAADQNGDSAIPQESVPGTFLPFSTTVHWNAAGSLALARVGQNQTGGRRSGPRPWTPRVQLRTDGLSLHPAPHHKGHRERSSLATLRPGRSRKFPATHRGLGVARR